MILRIEEPLPQAAFDALVSWVKRTDSAATVHPWPVVVRGSRAAIASARQWIAQLQPVDVGRAMRFIRQRCETDCGLAVAAMLTGKHYAEASNADPNPSAQGGMSLADFSACLSTLGGEWVAVRKSEKLEASRLPTDPCALLIRRHSAKWGHWVAWDGGMIFDPEMQGPLALGEYPRREWSLIRVVKRKEVKTK